MPGSFVRPLQIVEVLGLRKTVEVRSRTPMVLRRMVHIHEELLRRTYKAHAESVRQGEDDKCKG